MLRTKDSLLRTKGSLLRTKDHYSDFSHYLFFL